MVKRLEQHPAKAIQIIAKRPQIPTVAAHRPVKPGQEAAAPVPDQVIRVVAVTVAAAAVGVNPVAAVAVAAVTVEVLVSVS